MSKWIFLFFCLSTLLACGQEEAETIPVSVQNITEGVYASATIQPIKHYRVYPEVTGIVEEKWIEAGDTVSTTDRLFTIRNQTLDLQTTNARLNYELAKANLSGNNNQLVALKRQIELTQQQYQQDSLDYERQRSLWEQQIGSRQQLDQRALALANSKIRYRSAIDAYEQTRRQLKTEVQRADNNYRISTKNQDQFVLFSRMDGKIYELFVEPGETVNPQQPLAWIGSLDSFLIEMQVDEEDISQVHLGQMVWLTLDSYRGQTFKAKVSKIHPSMDGASQTFLVEARFVSPPPSLYPNLTAEANIVINQKENAMVIPRSYVLAGDSVILAGTRKKRAVELGIQDISKVEVKAGLQAGEIIEKPE